MLHLLSVQSDVFIQSELLLVRRRWVEAEPVCQVFRWWYDLLFVSTWLFRVIPTVIVQTSSYHLFTPSPTKGSYFFQPSRSFCCNFTFLYVQFFTFVLTTPFNFRHKNHLFTVRKRPCFGLPGFVATTANYPEAPLKISSFVATNTTGNCVDISLKNI